MKRMTILAAAGFAAALAANAGEKMDFTSIDANADGMVTQSELVTWMTADGKKTEAEAIQAFAKIDTSADGMVSETEFEAAKEKWKAKMDEKKSDKTY